MLALQSYKIFRHGMAKMPIYLSRRSIIFDAQKNNANTINQQESSSPTIGSKKTDQDNKKGQKNSEEYEPLTRKWFHHYFIICGVFALTGSSTVKITPYLLDEVFQLEGTFKQGPWSYRIIYVLTTLPIYTALLTAFGYMFKKPAYFNKITKRMWGRVIPKSILNKIYS